jgi:hypothetical protein
MPYFMCCWGVIVVVIDLIYGFTTAYAISAYHHLCCEFEFYSWWGVLDTTVHDKVCQWPAAGQWFSPGSPVSFTNKNDLHNITEILLKMAFNTINLTPMCCWLFISVNNSVWICTRCIMNLKLTLATVVPDQILCQSKI